MKKRILPFMMFVLAFAPLFAQVNITFELNTATIDVDPSGVYIAGGEGFGLPGDNPMLDPDGDGIYTITVQREVGFSSYYTFLNGNCSDWSCKETIAGLPCSDPANFDDRFFPPVMSDTTVLACFGTCDFNGSCTIVTDSIDITFELNTASIETIDPSGIFLAGGGNFGNPGDNPMVDPDGDGIYTITVTKPEGFSSHYTFLNGNCGDWSCKEDLSGLPCGDPNNFNDRFLPATTTNTTIQACFENCASDGSCDAVGLNNISIDETLFTLQPSIVNDFTNVTFGENAVNLKKQVVVMNAVGEVLHRATVQNEFSYQINATDFASGIYFLSVQTEDTILTRKFVVSK